MKKKNSSEKGKSPIQNQIRKIFRHTRQGSYGTRDRYEDSCNQFAKFLDENFKMKNLKNLADKHIVDYVRHRQEQGRSGNTVKNDLAAIRFLHDQVAEARNEISSNKDLQKKYGITLEKTPEVKGNRAWTDEEFNGMIKTARALGRDEIADAAIIARGLGLRISEVACMKRSQAEAALRTEVYPVGKEAKNGRERDNDYLAYAQEAKEALGRRLEATERGDRVFISSDQQAHEVINKLEKFFQNHRHKFETSEGRELRTYTDHNGQEQTHALTWHGLRYYYVQQRLQQELGQERSWTEAANKITQEVGHARTRVIRVYTAGKLEETEED